MSERANQRVGEALNRLVVEGSEIGIQVAAYLNGQLVIDQWAGAADLAGQRAVDGNTLFNAFSVAKGVTACALHLQIERGLVDYEASVATYWPEFAANDKAKITVRDVLTHRSGLPQMPPDVTPETLVDWHWMCRSIAAMKPMFDPGVDSAYQSMTFGWIIGEIVRRTDPGGRSFGDFVTEEIARPLGITDLWIGLPPYHESRVATLDGSSVYEFPEDSVYRLACPKAVDLMPDPFGRSEVRRASIPAVGLICNARSQARFFAMLACGGKLDDVRLLSADHVETMRVPRDNPEQPDKVFFGSPLALGNGGHWLGGGRITAAVRSARALCHTGMGGSIGWADPDTGLAVAICHNKLFNPPSPEQDYRVALAKVIEEALELV